MFNKKYLSNLIIILPLFFIIFAVIGTSYISISQLKNHFNHEIEAAKNQELNLQKQYIKNKIESVYSYIEHKKQESTKRLKERLIDRGYPGYELALNIYTQYRGKISDKALQKKILDTLRKVRFGKDGYYFVLHLKSEKEIITKLLPSTPHLENINAYDFQDLDDKYYAQEFANIVLKDTEGFIQYKYHKLNEKGQFNKLSFAKLFEPYDWIIGYGEYTDDIENSIKEEAKERLDLYQFKNSGYVWTHSTKYTLLQHPYRKKAIGTDDTNLMDKKGTKIIQMFVEKAVEKEEGNFVEYYWNKPNETELTQKIGYVKHIKEWDWVIGTGVYIEDIKILLNTLEIQKDEHLKQTTIKIVLLSLTILLIATFFLIFISRKMEASFLKYEEEIKSKHTIIMQQSKMAALGEMMGHIAHQWRQPLSVITTITSSWGIYNDIGKLTNEKVLEESEIILSNANYLSNTIEDFRYFVEGKNSTLQFAVNELMENLLSIEKFSLDNKHVQLICNTNLEQEVLGNQNEVLQVLINIVNNAIHALEENNESNRLLFIDVTQQQNTISISIKDNAGGIPSDIISKIFEPYFTTKHESKGTGLGLYMSYSIINKLDGKLSVKNISYDFEEENYNGACFTITLPTTFIPKI